MRLFAPCPSYQCYSFLGILSYLILWKLNTLVQRHSEHCGFCILFNYLLFWKNSHLVLIESLSLFPDPWFINLHCIWATFARHIILSPLPASRWFTPACGHLHIYMSRSRSVAFKPAVFKNRWRQKRNSFPLPSFPLPAAHLCGCRCTSRPTASELSLLASIQQLIYQLYQVYL